MESICAQKQNMQKSELDNAYIRVGLTETHQEINMQVDGNKMYQNRRSTIALVEEFERMARQDKEAAPVQMFTGIVHDKRNGPENINAGTSTKAVETKGNSTPSEATDEQSTGSVIDELIESAPKAVRANDAKHVTDDAKAKVASNGSTDFSRRLSRTVPFRNPRNTCNDAEKNHTLLRTQVNSVCQDMNKNRGSNVMSISDMSNNLDGGWIKDSEELITWNEKKQMMESEKESICNELAEVVKTLYKTVLAVEALAQRLK